MAQLSNIIVKFMGYNESEGIIYTYTNFIH
jgi:hypothetical protein